MRRLAFRAALAAAAVALIGTTVTAYLVRRNAQGAPIAWDLAASAPNQVAGRITFYIDTRGVPTPAIHSASVGTRPSCP